MHVPAPLFDVIEHAPAKINLALHVTGQRADGYHILDSLVTFADRGDVIVIRLADEDELTLSGRFSVDLPQDEDGKKNNLVKKARDLFRDDLLFRGLPAPPVHIHLEKNLPIASGIGGGSADAAATLRGLARIWRAPLSDKVRADLAMSLGADIPMCLLGKPLIARGIGEDLRQVPTMPNFSIVLANPLLPVSTPQVFRLLTNKDNPAMDICNVGNDMSGWLGILGRLRNDLEPPARQILPEIAIISDMLRSAGAKLVRMSGSGATCFGIFADPQSASDAEIALSRLRPDWYFQSVQTSAGDEA
jgi:4-diphosphocytidyl-2-C-methyl-D-erythritol kinase